MIYVTQLNGDIGILITLEDTGIFHITRQAVIDHPSYYAVAITITPTDIPKNDTPILIFPEKLGFCVLPFYVTPTSGGILFSSDNTLCFRVIDGEVLVNTEIVINGIVPKL